MNPEQVNEIIRLYTSRSKSIDELAKIYKKSNTAIRQILVDKGITIRKPSERPRKVNEEQFIEILDLYRQGTSLAKIAKKYGLNKGTITKYLKESNIRLRTKHEARRKIEPEDYEKTAQEYKEGKSLTDLAKENSCSLGSIRFVLQNAVSA